MLSLDWNNIFALVNTIILLIGMARGAVLFKAKIDNLLSSREADHIANQTRLKALEVQLEKFEKQLASMATAMVQLAQQETRLNAIDQRFHDISNRIEYMQEKKPATPVKRRKAS